MNQKLSSLTNYISHAQQQQFGGCGEVATGRIAILDRTLPLLQKALLNNAAGKFKL